MCTTYTWLAYSWPSSGTSSCRVTERRRIESGAMRSEPQQNRVSRHWVGLAIVAIQMAAWCVVGSLLIHRGVTNIRRHRQSHVDNVAVDQPGLGMKTPSPSSSESTVPHPAGDTDSVPKLWRSSPIDNYEDHLASESSTGTSTTLGPSSNLDDTTSISMIPELDFPEATADRRNTKLSYFPQEGPLPPFLPPEKKDSVTVSTARPRKVTTSGTATAVVMVTVGGIMLVVGPAFLLIKILDVYQRQRRLQKLFQREDPPPSYEEVTEKVPRYSALFHVADSGELVPLAYPEAPPVLVPSTSPSSGSALVSHHILHETVADETPCKEQQAD